jgi:SAM-dependent methyltransferase
MIALISTNKIKSAMTQDCPLCSGTTDLIYKHKKQIYFICRVCRGISIDKSLLPGPEKEKERYLQHNNDIEDKGYQSFVFPVIEAVTRDFKVHDKGLDFGAGTGPVVSKLLRDKGYDISLYDPFFHNHPELLTREYDYIVCCEVAEHFHHPGKEFDLLKRMLAPGGKIYCLTLIYDESIDFSTWPYKNDLTHVFIYMEETFAWIKENIGFSCIMIEKRLITISK